MRRLKANDYFKDIQTKMYQRNLKVTQPYKHIQRQQTNAKANTISEQIVKH